MKKKSVMFDKNGRGYNNAGKLCHVIAKRRRSWHEEIDKLEKYIFMERDQYEDIMQVMITKMKTPFHCLFPLKIYQIDTFLKSSFLLFLYSKLLSKIPSVHTQDKIHMY